MTGSLRVHDIGRRCGIDEPTVVEAGIDHVSLWAVPGRDRVGGARRYLSRPHLVVESLLLLLSRLQPPPISPATIEF